MRVEQRYDATVADVLATALDKDFLLARSARYGGTGRPSVDRSGPEIVVRVPRQLPLEHVPGPFRRFVGDGRLVQVDTWTEVTDRRAFASWAVETGRAPVDLHGTHEIATVPDGSRSVITGTIKVHLPMGARLARQVESHLAQLVESELSFLSDWLDAA